MGIVQNHPYLLEIHIQDNQLWDVKSMNPILPEKRIIGSRTLERVIKWDECRSFYELGIRLIGISDVRAPYSISTNSAHRGLAVASVGGLGKVWVDGKWSICRPGESYLCPTGKPLAYHPLPSHSWKFVWIIFDAPAPWLRNLTRARHLPSDHVFALLHAAEGLYLELREKRNPALSNAWAQLVSLQWEAIAQGHISSKKLRSLWEQVDSKLAHPWNIEEMARISGFGSEQLRRICHKETGRAPMQQVTYLRMVRAELLLQTGKLKVSAVSEVVGYENPFAFSSTYNKWKGVPPSHVMKFEEKLR
jgi:AraC-like DNA-binding protein